ncbi:MAG: hypothetical protein JWM32_1455 [Verrucomicrobia bacterium]|nr:hypothetical protein [Verrucomicrobiota bacterium]
METEVPHPFTGRWQVVKAELAGDEMPAFVAEKMELQFSEGNYLVSFAGDVSDRGHFALGVSGGFKTVVLTGVEGSNAGRTIPAIYQHAGDRLRICYGLDGIFPSEFSTAANQNLYLATYRRVSQ